MAQVNKVKWGDKVIKCNIRRYSDIYKEIDTVDTSIKIDREIERVTECKKLKIK